MISELFLIRSNSSFWNELFPGGEDYIRLLNSGLGRNLFDPITNEEHPNRRAIVNTLAFALFEVAVLKNWSFETINKYSFNSTEGKALFNKEIKRLSNLRYGSLIKNLPDENELSIIQTTSKRLLNNYRKNRGLKIRPTFPGCGIVNSAEGDLYYTGTLVEVKAGQRNFSIQDVRQLYTYLALNQLNNNYEIMYLELFNPRTGFLWRENKEVVSQNISGNSTIEIVTEIINYITTETNSK